MNNNLNPSHITGRTTDPNGYDFYETPAWATEKALDQMIIDGIINKYDDILEPCSGAGAISNVLEAQGFENVKSSDNIKSHLSQGGFC